MELTYQLVKNNQDIYYQKTKHLFEHAFPPIERPTFNMFMTFKHHEMYAVEDRGTFVGLIDILKYKNTLYIFFLTIKKTFRGKGYGSQIIKDIRNKYNDHYSIYLLAENPDIECDNKNERINRITFYKKNGFILSDIEVIEFEVNYRILYLKEIVSKNIFIESMKYLLGDDRFNNYYSKHVR